MVLSLVRAEDVNPDGQCQCKNVNADVVVTEELRDTFDGIYDLTVAALETEGYKSYTLPHPTIGRDISYFVMGGKVISVDYHGLNVTATILPEKDANSVIENIKEAFGEGELTN